MDVLEGAYRITEIQLATKMLMLTTPTYFSLFRCKQLDAVPYKLNLQPNHLKYV
jgi:hypothetical protein